MNETFGERKKSVVGFRDAEAEKRMNRRDGTVTNANATPAPSPVDSEGKLKTICTCRQ